MSEAINSLVDAIVAKDSISTETAFSAAMAEKLSDRLEDMRVSVAKSMFSTPETTGQEEQE